VTDHGPGFSPEQAEHFFDPFFTSKQNQGHIGIGGYIAHNVARDALAASLDVQSAPGQTTVTLLFTKIPEV
jgi:C4-dicarboxylate-specific signal transduction histidine kinase